MISDLEKLYFKDLDYIIVSDMLVDKLVKNLISKDRFYSGFSQKCANENCSNFFKDFIWLNGDESFYITEIDRFYLMELTCEHCCKVTMMIQSIDLSIENDLDKFIKEKSIVFDYDSFLSKLENNNLANANFINKLIKENHINIILSYSDIYNKKDVKDIGFCVEIYPFYGEELITLDNYMFFFKRFFNKYYSMI